MDSSDYSWLVRDFPTLHPSPFPHNLANADVYSSSTPNWNCSCGYLIWHLWAMCDSEVLWSHKLTANNTLTYIVCFENSLMIVHTADVKFCFHLLMACIDCMLYFAEPSVHLRALACYETLTDWWTRWLPPLINTLLIKFSAIWTKLNITTTSTEMKSPFSRKSRSNSWQIVDGNRTRSSPPPGCNQQLLSHVTTDN